MGDRHARVSAVNLCPFVGVDLNLWPTVHIAVIVLTQTYKSINQSIKSLNRTLRVCVDSCLSGKCASGVSQWSVLGPILITYNSSTPLHSLHLMILAKLSKLFLCFVVFYCYRPRFMLAGRKQCSCAPNPVRSINISVFYSPVLFCYYWQNTFKKNSIPIVGKWLFISDWRISISVVVCMLLFTRKKTYVKHCVKKCS